jgi:hypothetical protein
MGEDLAFQSFIKAARGAVLGLTALGWTGCLVEEIKPGQVCEDVASAIASRTYACTGDPKLANGRAERFERAHRCVTDDFSNLEELYLCPVSIQALPCAQVAANAEAWSQWLATSSTCSLVLTPGAP